MKRRERECCRSCGTCTSFTAGCMLKKYATVTNGSLVERYLIKAGIETEESLDGSTELFWQLVR